MRSQLPKVLHPVAGKPMVLYALEIARSLDITSTVVVLGHEARQVRAVLGPDVLVAEQTPQLGTAHAVRCARPLLPAEIGGVLVLYGDTPLLRPSTVLRMMEAAKHSTLVMLTAHLEDPAGYGRVLRDSAGRVIGVVEDRDASPSERAIKEVNSGVMLLRAPWLWTSLEEVPPAPSGEYYLTDLVGLAARQGLTITAVHPDEPEELLGVNDRRQLARATQVIWERQRQRWMDHGVTLVEPGTVYIEPDVTIGEDTVVYQGTRLRGRTTIGRECEIGPGSDLVDAVVGDRCRVVWSSIESSTLGNDVRVGPYAHLRPGCVVEDGVELGNYAEVKASRIGARTKVHHFSYLGDAQVGRDVNIGAGTITCNYDGRAKHRTIIEDSAFIGSDTMLVAPVTIGREAGTGAGSVVTRDVPAGQVVVGVPARPLRRPDEPSATSRSSGETSAAGTPPEATR